MPTHRRVTADPAVPRAAGEVQVVLVVHDGARWLPGVVAGLLEQDVAPTRVVCVDTGSRDDGLELLAPLGARFGDGLEVVRAPAGTGFPDAVRLGVERLDPAGAGGEVPAWLWVLHDDARPAPDALRRLLEAAARRPDAAILGPKLREWPSLRRLLEVGATISGTGRRETGLERGEYDQGQHDEEREVLAVHTAGLLARRDAWERLGGLDPRLALFGNDLDLGWRAAAAGLPVLVVPSAVVFHAEAAHRGLRRTPLTGRHTHFQERRAALYTLLVNSRAAALPWRVLRLTLGTLVRMVGLLLVRAPGEALDDLAALVAVVGRPGAVRAGRRERRERQRVADVGRDRPDRARVARLLAPWWVPYRHGLDAIGDVVSAAMFQAADVADRRRQATAEADPSSLAAARLRAEREAGEEDQELADTGWVARLLTSPVALASVAVVVLLLVASRSALGSTAGGVLSPAPDDAGDWWSLHYATAHLVGLGTDAPAPPAVLPLAVLATVLVPVLSPGGLVSAVLLLAAPVALWGAWRFLRVVGRLASHRGAPRWLLLGGATTYALVPATSGAWGGGRLGLVVAAAALPWLAHAALGFADPDADRRRRAGWRVGLLLTLLTCFAPSVWPVAVAVALLATVAARALGLTGGGAARPPWVAVLVPVVLLAPWWVAALLAGTPAALALEPGRQPAAPASAVDLLAGRLPGLDGAPASLGLAVAVLAVLALLPRATRIPVLVCWAVVTLATAVAVLLDLVVGTLDLPAVTTHVGVGGALLVVAAGLLTAAVLGAQGALRQEGSRRRLALPLVAVGAAATALVPLLGAVWFVTADPAIGSEVDGTVPTYMLDRAARAPERGVMVVSGDLDAGLVYDVRRGAATTVGEDELLAVAPERPEVTALVGDLLARPTDESVAALGRIGVQYLVLAAPADGRVAADLDSAGGLQQASSAPGSRAWQVTVDVDVADIDVDPAGGLERWLRISLWVVQGAGLLAGLVLAAPTVRRRPDAEEDA